MESETSNVEAAAAMAAEAKTGALAHWSVDADADDDDGTDMALLSPCTA